MQPYEYVERGHGEPIVFLHGLFGNTEEWMEVGRHLDDDARTIAPHLPFNGRHPGLDSIEGLVEYLRGFLDAISLERAVIGGNSLGGQVGLALALAHPDRVAGLVLAASAGLTEQSIAGGAHPRTTPEFIREKARDVFYDPRHITDDLVARVRAMLLDRPTALFLVRVAKSSRDTALWDLLPTLRAPTLLVWGADDRITPPSVAEDFHSRIPGSRLTFIGRCGHAPQREHPAQFASAVRAFLRPSSRAGDVTAALAPD